MAQRTNGPEEEEPCEAGWPSEAARDDENDRDRVPTGRPRLREPGMMIVFRALLARPSIESWAVNVFSASVLSIRIVFIHQLALHL